MLSNAPAPAADDDDDALAEALADHLVELVVSPDADPLQRRGILNRLMEDMGFGALPILSREVLAPHYGLTPRQLRDLELAAIEKLRLNLPDILDWNTP